MKQIYDLFDFENVEIKTRQDSYDHVYTATLKKYMTFEMFDEREYLPTKEEWIEKAKETFVKKIISDDFMNKWDDEDDVKYFTDLKNAIENTGLVDQFLWDRGYKRLGSTWQPKSISKKQSSVEWLFFELSYTPKDKFEWHTILRKAKAMHKEEVEQYGAMCCLRTTQKNQWSLEGLYNETFGGQE